MGDVVVNVRLQTLLLLLWLPLSAAMAAGSSPRLGETLQYTLSFRGLLSGFVELDIARLTLSVEPRMQDVAGMSAYVTRLQLTTAPYRKAELLYPVRLDYRSWLDARLLQPLLATRVLHTDESKRELFWYDRQSGNGHVYRVSDGANPPDEAAAGKAVTPPDYLRRVAARLDESWNRLLQTRQVALQVPGVIDYMGLLHQLRHANLQPGKTLRFTVFTGKRIEHYRVEVAKGRLQRGGWDRPVYYLRLFEYDPQKDALKDEVKLWLSDDDQRLLLRFYAERAVGALEGILETGRPQDGAGERLSEATEQSLERYLDF
jgi:hypothetical protein